MNVSGLLLPIAFGWLAVSTPWLVVRIVTALAPPEAAGAADRRLPVATLISLAVIAVVGTVTEPPSLAMGLADLVGFAVMSAIAWPSLSEVDRRSRASRDIDSASRVASLRPRRVSEYLPPLFRAVPFLIATAGAVIMAVRVSTPVGLGERRLIPIMFVLSAVVFLLLYHRWIDQEVTGAQVADPPTSDATRHQRIQSIYVWQVALVVGLTTLGHLLLNVNWVSGPVWSQALAMTGALAGGVLGVIGCARALTSDLHARRYRTEAE